MIPEIGDLGDTVLSRPVALVAAGRFHARLLSSFQV
jgi:hypothetical protein